MKNLLISLLSASALIACSSDKPPQPNNCHEARALVKQNNNKINQAFLDDDAGTIGTLELQNRDIIRSNMECFPKIKKYKKHWQKIHDDK